MSVGRGSPFGQQLQVRTVQLTHPLLDAQIRYLGQRIARKRGSSEVTHPKTQRRAAGIPVILVVAALLGFGAIGFGCQSAANSSHTLAPGGSASERPEQAVESSTQSIGQEAAFSFDVGDRTLFGVLSLPANAGGRVPAVVIVHGSGQMTRDGILLGQLGMPFGFRFAAYRALARSLQERGIAVLRYDKRSAASVSQPTSEQAGGTTLEFESDALAALQALAQHGSVDPNALFVVGHSQGGQLVPWVLSKAPQAAGGILLSAPHGAIHETLSSQAHALTELLLDAGHPGSEALAASGQLALLAEQIARLQPPNLDGQLLGVEKSFWYRWRLMSGGAPWLAAHLKQPLLVVSGRRDHNVGTRDFQRWQQTLSTSRTPHQFTTIDCMTHALNCIEDGEDQRPGNPTEQLAPGLSERIAEFIHHSSER